MKKILLSLLIGATASISGQLAWEFRAIPAPPIARATSPLWPLAYMESGDGHVLQGQCLGYHSLNAAMAAARQGSTIWVAPEVSWVCP